MAGYHLKISVVEIHCLFYELGALGVLLGTINPCVNCKNFCMVLFYVQKLCICIFSISAFA
jgi:hypothetical protein